jgi:hypothetical protein
MLEGLPPMLGGLHQMFGRLPPMFGRLPDFMEASAVVFTPVLAGYDY